MNGIILSEVSYAVQTSKPRFIIMFFHKSLVNRR